MFKQKNNNLIKTNIKPELMHMMIKTYFYVIIIIFIIKKYFLII